MSNKNIPTKMAAKTKLLLVSLISSCVFIVLLCGDNVVSATEDPELQQCKHQCRHQGQFDRYEKFLCEKKCEDYIKQKEAIEEIGSERGNHHHHQWPEGEGEGEGFSHQKEQRCITRCRLKKVGAEERRRCEDWCRDVWRREKEWQREKEEGEGHGEEEGERGEGFPYVFDEKHFETQVETEEGRFRLLKKFNERSKLLRGIEKYRLGFFEANPLTFLSPAHFDSDVVFFVAKGKTFDIKNYVFRFSD